MHYKMVMTLSVIVKMLSVVACDRRANWQDQKNRQSRFISFQTTDDDIKVGLDFTIPFITIPVKKALDPNVEPSDIFSNFPSVNINVAGLALGGAVVLGSTFILPFLIKGLAVGAPDQPYARVLETSEFQSDILLSGVNELLTADRHALSCVQRLACSAARNSAIMSGDSSSALLEDMATNPIITSILNGTAIDVAVQLGYDGYNCTERYIDCPISQANMKLFMNNLAKLGKI